MAERKSGFYCENHSVVGLEAWLNRHVFPTVVTWIPAAVSPNVLSLINHVFAWSVLVAAGLSVHLGPQGALIARVYAAFAVMACVFLDCLDGMHARRTGQTSRLGEVLDHWLDSINVPIMACAIVLTLGIDPWTASVGVVTATMLYNAQLVLYHHTGRFVHPTTSGIDGQILLSVAYVGFALLFYYVPRDDFWMPMGLRIFTIAVIGLQVQLGWFYWKRLRGMMAPHLWFIAVCTVFSGLYIANIITEPVYMLCIVMLSFRVTGTYVLYTVVGKSYRGMDWALFGWAALIAAAHYLLGTYSVGGYSVRTALPFLFVAYVALTNLVDFFRNLADLLPEARKTR